MGVAAIPIEDLERSARIAAQTQWSQLSRMRFDASDLEVRPLSPPDALIDTCGVVAADAGQMSVALAPFHLELLHVTDHRGTAYLSEFFPLTTIAEDLAGVFERSSVLRAFASRLLLHWQDLTDLWERTGHNQPPMPRDVRVVADTLREISEWAVAMHLAEESLGDESAGQAVRRLVLHDGTLRSILLRADVIRERLPAWWQNVAWRERRVVIAGIGKSSLVWQRLALALSLDARVQGFHFCYVPVPEKVELAMNRAGAETKRLGFGKLVLLKTRQDALGQFLPVDLPPWIMENRMALDAVLGQILRVSQTTFPQPGYPAPLEAAHQSAHLSEFDAKVVRDVLVSALRGVVPESDFEPMLRFWAFSAEKWKKTGRIGQD